MAKLKKMLGRLDSDYSVALMRLIETQSKTTITNWSIHYVEEHLLPIYAEAFPNDTRLQEAIAAVYDCLEGNLKVAEAKKIAKDAQVAAKEAEGQPAAQAAARAIVAATSTLTTPTSSLGVAYYLSAAIAYHTVGLNETEEVYEQIAAAECMKMHASLKNIAIENEPNLAKINWNC